MAAAKHPIEEQLLKATKANPRARGESDQDYRARLVAAASPPKFTDAQWDALDEPTQKWINAATVATDRKTPLPAFDADLADVADEVTLAEPDVAAAETNAKAAAAKAKKDAKATKAAAKKAAAPAATPEPVAEGDEELKDEAAVSEEEPPPPASPESKAGKKPAASKKAPPPEEKPSKPAAKAKPAAPPKERGSHPLIPATDLHDNDIIKLTATRPRPGTKVEAKYELLADGMNVSTAVKASVTRDYLRYFRQRDMITLKPGPSPK